MAKSFLNQSGYPVGFRNNNPGNLRPGVVPWMGQIGVSNNFCQFKDMSWGLRAMALDLSNKITRDGLNTITAIITKYAPPSENDTQSYINLVSQYTGWGASDIIDFNSDSLLTLMRAQMNVEDGKKYADLLSDADILEGISLMPESIFSRVKDFFVNNPGIAAVAGLGISAVAIYIIILLVRHKKVNLQSFKNVFK